MSARIAVLKAETRLFAREPATLFWVMVFPSLLLLGFGLIPRYGDAEPDVAGQRIIEFYVPATVLVGLITASVQAMPAALTGYRERGVLRRMRTTPARPADLLLAQVVLHAAAALLSTALVLVLGRVVHEVAAPRHAVAYLVTLALSAAAALALGAMITALSRTSKIAGAVGLLVLFPAMFAAGIYVPLPVLPEVVRQVIELTAFGAAAGALEQAAAGHWPSWNHVVVLAVWTAGSLAVAVRWFRWE